MGEGEVREVDRHRHRHRHRHTKNNGATQEQSHSVLDDAFLSLSPSLTALHHGSVCGSWQKKATSSPGHDQTAYMQDTIAIARITLCPIVSLNSMSSPCSLMENQSCGREKAQTLIVSTDVAVACVSSLSFPYFLLSSYTEQGKRTAAKAIVTCSHTHMHGQPHAHTSLAEKAGASDQEKKRGKNKKSSKDQIN